MTSVPSHRRADIVAALARIQDRIRQACVAAGRTADEVRLLAVTKNFPSTDAALLVDLGLTDLAENRVDEASRKATELARMRPASSIRWHMVGRLQRNKIRSVLRWASEIQSVDSPRLVLALNRAMATAPQTERPVGPLDVLIQVSLDGNPGRGGCPLNAVGQLADLVAQSGELQLRGLMAVAPLPMVPLDAFQLLARAHERLRSDHPGATELSAGMSGDMEQAIAYGATCVRVGTALLGGRGLASP